MSYASDDLTPLLVPDPQTRLGFRQGVVLTWDQATGENTIDVGGATLTNLPIMNTSDAADLVPGAVVGILTVGPSWFITGRIIAPGAPGAGGALALGRTIEAYDTTADATASGTYVDLGGPSASVVIGASGRCLVTVGCQMDYGGGPATNIASGGRMSVALSGANTKVASNDTALVFADQINLAAVNANLTVTRRASYTHSFTGLNPGLTTFTTQYSAVYPGNSVSFADRTLVVQPI